jgi:alkylhydroperoxidase family enzyme
MAFIQYKPLEEIPAEDRLSDEDNILRIHAINSRVMKHHYDLYLHLMHKTGPLTRELREMVAVAVSAVNQCHY